MKLSCVLLWCFACTPGWSPESAEIIFTSNRSGNADIYVSHGADTLVTNLSNNEAGDNWASWSPDGRFIVFQRKISAKFDVWIMNADGSGQRQLTDDPDHDYLPEWVPGGKQITFSSWRKEPFDTVRAPHIYIMNRDGKEQRRLMKETLNTSGAAAWSPDGKTFVVTRVLGNQADLFLMDSKGDVLQKLTNDTLYDGSPEFSPDGNHIAFYADGGGRSDIIVIRKDGLERKVLASGGHFWYPHWSPDGQWLICTVAVPGSEGRDLDLYALSVTENTPPRLLKGGLVRVSEGRWRR